MASIVADKKSALVVVVGAWSALLACRVCSAFYEQLSSSGVLIIGIFCLISNMAAVFLLRDRRLALEPIYFIFMLGSFSSVADILIALEADGRIRGWMEFYLVIGEPYLVTPHGIAICYWDFFGHYSLYIAMLWFICKGNDVRNLAMFWFGSIFHSLIVFLPGNVLGIYGVEWSYLLNVPYIFVPLYVFHRVSQKDRSRINLTGEARKSVCSSIFCRPFDLFLIVTLILSIVIAFIRGFAAFDCSIPFFRAYRDEVEPYMSDPVFYPKLQMLTYLFHFSVGYACSIYALLWPGCAWMLDLSFIFAGAAVQAQLTHIMASLHWKTEKAFQPPEAGLAKFWAVNLLLLVAPLVLMCRVLYRPQFFLVDRPVEEKKKKSR